MKKLIISFCLILALSFNAKAEFFSDVILTGIQGVWVDSRSYSSLSAAVTAIGANDRELVIVSPQVVTTLTIPSNVRLRFIRNGSITNSGQLTIQTKNIEADNRQIFTGVGNIDFATGTVLKTAWFSNFETATALTVNDTVTLKVTKAHTLTASFALGNNVVLSWDSPANQLSANAGVTLSNIGQVIAGNYQLFAGAGNFRFRDGTKLNLSWFAHLRSAITHASTNLINLEVNVASTVDFTDTVPSTISIYFTKGGSFALTGGVVLTINGHVSAGEYQIISGAGTATFNYLSEVLPEWYGVSADGLTNDAVAFQAAVTAATRFRASGIYRLNAAINLKSNSVYNFSQALFVPGAVMTRVFLISGKNNVEIIGGSFTHNDLFSPLTVLPTGTYVDTTAIHITNSDNIKVHGQLFTEYWCSVNVYDGSDNVEVYETISIDGNAALAAVAETAVVSNPYFHDNTIVGCGDDGIAFITRTNTFDIVAPRAINNYIDKTRLSGDIGAAVGIRAGLYNGGSGAVRGLVIKGNFLKDMVDNGIYVHNTEVGVISDNTVDGYAKTIRNGSGIDVGVAAAGACDDLLVSNNNISHPGTASSYIIHGYEIANSIFSGNRGEAASPAGFGAVLFENSLNNVHIGNTYRNTTLLSTVFQTSGTSALNDLIGNRLTAADTTAPFVMTGTNRIETNTHQYASFADGDATPSVGAGNFFYTGNTAPTTITTFHDSYAGHKFKVFFGDVLTTIDFTATNLKGNGGLDWTPLAFGWMECTNDGTNFYCSVDRSALPVFDTLAVNDTSPTVLNRDLWLTANTVPTTIVSFDNGHIGQQIKVILGDANTTIDFSASVLHGNGGVDWTPNAGDWLSCINYDGTEWYCAVHDTTL